MSDLTNPAAPSEPPQWDSLAGSQGFAALLRRKRRFLVPAMGFFIVYYFALPVLVGYFPEFMSRKVLGPVNLAYLFALSQFVMAWTLAWRYLRAAEGFDRLAEELRNEGNKKTSRAAATKAEVAPPEGSR